MEKFSDSYFKKLANQIMIDLSDEEIHSLREDFKIMLDQMELLDKVNTDGVNEMIYPFDVETKYLRDDSCTQVLSKEDVLENAPEVKAGQIIVPKVVG